MNDECARALAALNNAGCDVALLSSVANVTYVSGMEVPLPFGAGPELTYGPWLALLSVHDRACWLIVPASHADLARSVAPWSNVLSFALMLNSFEPVDARTSYRDAVSMALRHAGVPGRKLRFGVEFRSLPMEVAEIIATAASDVEWRDAEAAVQRARLIKTPREIDLLRRAARVADVAHTTLARLCLEAGRTECEMWGEIATEVTTHVGRDIPLTGELVTGPRTTEVAYPNGPRQRRTQPGDAALMDLSGRIDGYWFDCTNTHIIGGVQPMSSQARLARASQEACEAAMAALRPGTKASDAYRAAENVFACYGLPVAHYAGHQIGVTVNELPRLVPYDDTVIEPGMVFAVEPGAYEGPGGSFGARSEKMVLVTESGPEILSDFSWGISMQ